jgi:hypothetical protein
MEGLQDVSGSSAARKDRNKRLVGIVSVSDLARKEPQRGTVLAGIAQPSDQHNQTAAA